MYYVYYKNFNYAFCFCYFYWCQKLVSIAYFSLPFFKRIEPAIAIKPKYIGVAEVAPAPAPVLVPVYSHEIRAVQFLLRFCIVTMSFIGPQNKSRINKKTLSNGGSSNSKPTILSQLHRLNNFSPLLNILLLPCKNVFIFIFFLINI